MAESCGWPVEASVRTVIARSAAKAFGGDLNSAGSDHYGRLAGFTNPKAEHRMSEGLAPFVRLREWSGQVMARAREVLAQAARLLDAQEAPV